MRGTRTQYAACQVSYRLSAL